MPWARVRASVAGVLGRTRRGAVRPGPGVGHGDPAARRSWSPSWAAHGILVVPVAGRMLRVERDPGAPDGRRVTEHGHYRFVPLVTD